MNVTSIVPSYNKTIPVMDICTDDFLTQDRMNALDEVAIRFLDLLSQHILKKKNIRVYPELIALAYWLRKSNIRTMVADFQKTIRPNKEVVVPRGVSFHVTPSNVDRH
jgi:hypothetical protein